MINSTIRIFTAAAAALSIICSAASAQNPSYDHDAYFSARYDEAGMKYSAGRMSDFRTFGQWQAAFRGELREKLGINLIETRLNGFKPHAENVDCEDLGYATRERWIIWTEPDVPLPVVLLRPKDITGKLPLMITPHGHSRNTEVFAGIYKDEHDRQSGEDGERNVALQAVQHGFLAIAPSERGFGVTRTAKDIRDDKTCSCREQLMHDLLVGRTPIGDRVWDIMKIIDWALGNLPADPSRIIVSGNSGGGTVTLYAGAVDTRISMSLPASAFCTFKGSIGCIHHCDCNYIPGIMQLGDMGDIAGLTAPRFFCAIQGVKDNIFPIEESRKAFESVKAIYQAADAPGNCEMFEGPEGHRYYKDGAWDFIDRNLRQCSFTASQNRLEDRIGVCTSVKNGAKVMAAGGAYVEVGVNRFLTPEKTDGKFEDNFYSALACASPICCANGFYPADLILVGPEADHPRALDYAEKAMKRASMFGISTIVLGSGKARSVPEGFSRQDAEEQFIDLLRKMGPIAQRYGITVVIEPLQASECNFINTVREGTFIAERVNHPNIGVLADFFHMARMGEDPGAIVEAGSLLKHCHIAEKENRTPPGTARDNFRPYLKALLDIGYTGNLSIEAGWKAFDDQLPKAVAEIKKQIRQARNQK